MYLKSIEVQGFKSFADKTALDFHQGITAIVGPNGSGKSNISDAVRWVMGEQSAKSLRGGKMEDVIFSGTQSRKPLGFAEVSLCLDNSEKFFSLDFSEITVTRRVYRNGDSEYFINKAPCRLKDIHELFMDTGLGREGYSIIGQGKIDNILSSKSEDRRQIFEEASGITKYKYRKNEAERKLAQTQENLVRIKDILSELESRLEPLKNQSERARRYLVLRDELKTLDVTVSLNSIDNYRLDLKETEKNYSIVSNQLDEVKESIEKTDGEISELMRKLVEYDNEMDACRNAEKELSDSINENTNQINIYLSSIDNNKLYISRLSDEVEQTLRTLEGTERVLSENEAALASHKAALDEASKEIAEAEKKADDIAKAIEKYNDELETSKSEIVDMAVAVNSNRAQAANLEILMQNFSSRRAAIDEELSGKAESCDSLSEALEELKKAISEKDEEINSLKEHISVKDGEYGAKERELSTVRERNNSALISINQKISKKNLLEDMEKGFEGYAKSVKLIMNAHKSGQLRGVEIHAPLSQLISAEKKYIVAIEVALGSAGQNIVVGSEDDAKRTIEFLKSRNAGRATFMPVSSIKGRSIDLSRISRQRGYIGVASELAEYDEKYSEIVKNVLGTTVIMDNFDNAVSAASATGHKIRIVTLSGEVMQTSGAITGGSLGKNMSFLSRAAEIEELTGEIARLKSEAEKDGKKADLISDELSALTREIAEANDRLISLSEEHIKLSSDYTHTSALAETVLKDRKQLENERESVNARISEITAQIEEKKRKTEEYNRKIKELEAIVSSGTDGFDDLMRESNEMSEVITGLSIKKNGIIKDVELQYERIEAIKSERSDTLETIDRRLKEISEFESKNAEMTESIEKAREAIDKYGIDTSASKQRLEELAQEKKLANERISALQSGSKEVRDTMFGLQNQAARIEGKKAKLETELESIVNRLWEDYELTYTDALSQKSTEGLTMAEARKRISEIRTSIKSLGNINVDSIEEYKEIKERFDFLTNQTQDLESAKSDLEKVITDITAVMKEQFSEQFKVINQKFREVFAELFGGGRAELSLTDPADVLESGIEIEAQPPGKKLQSLMLLSGGERAFTAIALLFAILSVRPTPFCILDEIEAALDEVNVYRFAEFLKQYSQKTQFIVVTHRRGTMEAANILYGVTMQERGVSKLLSLNIDEVAK